MSNLVIKVADLPEEFPAIAAIRKSVFQQEQGVHPALEFVYKSFVPKTRLCGRRTNI